MRILLIDDDKDLLEMTSKRLVRKGCEVVATETLSEAVALNESETGGFKVIVCDLFLGHGENGLNFFDVLTEKNFSGKFILTTGDDSGDKRIKQYKDSDARFVCLQKPYPLDTLVQIIKEAS